VKRPYEYGNEVARAVAVNAPVVALETTVVTQGLPHPDGVTTALALEQITWVTVSRRFSIDGRGARFRIVLAAMCWQTDQLPCRRRTLFRVPRRVRTCDLDGQGSGDCHTV